MSVELRQFAPRGVIALEPKAFGASWEKQTTAEPFSIVGRLAIVTVCGPLAYQRTPDNWFQTYAEITSAVRAASEAPGIDTIVIKLNTPGGEVSGAFDCARDIRSIAQAAGKRLVSFTEAQAASAGYAIACAADEIVISDVAKVGSVGVITMIADATALDAALGVRFSVISSGARKSDGNPHVVTTAEAIDAVQVEVDTTAAVFFGYVSERRGIAVESIADLQAAQFVGVSAVGVRLADSVESFSAFRDRISASRTPVVSTETSMADEDKDKPKEDAVRAALVTASESDDEEKASKAKRALAAYDTEQSDDDKPAKKDDEDSKASASLAQAVAPLAKQVAAQQAELAALKAEADASKRASLFAARPDIKPELIKSLDATPTSALKAVLDAIPVTAGFVNPHVTVPATRPTIGANGGRPGLSANAELNEQMGLIKKTQGVAYEANSQVFGAITVQGGSK